MTFARERDQHERHSLIQSQMKDRQSLQAVIRENRRQDAERILGLYRDAANFRRMRSGELAQGRGDRQRGKAQGPELGL